LNEEITKAEKSEKVAIFTGMNVDRSLPLKSGKPMECLFVLLKESSRD
jgi:hypothetical protein